MESETEVRGQAEQLGIVIDMLVAMLGTIGDAFIRQQSRHLDDPGKEQQNLVEEIAFAMTLADEQMVGLPAMSRKPFIRYQSILVHLRLVAETIQNLAEVLRQQVSDGIPFSDKAIDHARHILERQKKLLGTLAEIVRTGDGERLQEIARGCRELGRSCLQFATSHESRLVEGLCLPKAAPLFLTIIDRAQTLIYHELETVKLLSRWI
jgi:Na+/phosphate symporter